MANRSISESLRDIESSTFIECFEDIPDSRDQDHVMYPMQETLFLVVASVISGYEENRAIEDFGRLKLDWLRQYFPFNNGIPTHGTIGNIIGLIDTQFFEKAFREWVNRAFGIASNSLLHIDGKRISGSVDKELQGLSASKGGKSASLIVNTYVSDTKTVVAQADVSQSGDEKEGAKRLIEQLHLKDKIITGDGNYCTKDILQRIRKKKGHYLMALKGNQPLLKELAEQYFDDVRIDKMPHHTDEQAHGRSEQRTYHAIRVDQFGHDKIKEYAGLCKIIRVRRQREVLRKKQAQKSDEIHFYITSSDQPIAYLANAIRKHWQVENNLHWVLDVEFKEDHSRKRTGNQAANFSLIRKVALNMIEQHRGKKSIKATRMACALSDEKRQLILGFT
ncbi:MAG: ISAs1 family transposase [Bacteroidota bacterium]